MFGSYQHLSLDNRRIKNPRPVLSQVVKKLSFDVKTSDWSWLDSGTTRDRPSPPPSRRIAMAKNIDLTGKPSTGIGSKRGMA
jgi:hypothetical protein